MRCLALVLIATTACGDNIKPSTPPDAGPTIDSSVDAGPPAPVKLTITAATGAIANVRVHFQNADSSVVLSTNTDASGVASVVMSDGGFVTAVDPFLDPGGAATFVELHTFAGVKAGDELVLYRDDGGAVTQVTVIGPRDTDSSVTNYRFVTPCVTSGIAAPASGNPETTIGFFPACSPTTDVLIASLDASQEVVKFAYAANQTISGTTLDLSGLTLAAPTSKSYTFNNVPASSNFAYYQHLRSARGRLWEATGPITGTTTVTGALDLPAFTGALDVVIGDSDFALGRHGMMDWGAFSTGFTTDVTARLLREVTGAPTFDTTNHRVTWTEAATGQTPDFALTFATAFRGSPSQFVRWALTGPYTPGALQFPTLPVESNLDYNFQATDATDVEGLILAKVSGGYDAVRELVLASDGPTGLVAGSNGTLTFEQAFGIKTRLVNDLQGKLGAREAVAPGWVRRAR